MCSRIYNNRSEIVDKLVASCRKDDTLHRPCPESPDVTDLHEYWVRLETTATEDTVQGHRSEMSIGTDLGKD